MLSKIWPRSVCRHGVPVNEELPYCCYFDCGASVDRGRVVGIEKLCSSGEQFLIPADAIRNRTKTSPHRCQCAAELGRGNARIHNEGFTQRLRHSQWLGA